MEERQRRKSQTTHSFPVIGSPSNERPAPSAPHDSSDDTDNERSRSAPRAGGLPESTRNAKLALSIDRTSSLRSSEGANGIHVFHHDHESGVASRLRSRGETQNEAWGVQDRTLALPPLPSRPHSVLSGTTDAGNVGSRRKIDQRSRSLHIR